MVLWLITGTTNNYCSHLLHLGHGMFVEQFMQKNCFFLFFFSAVLLFSYFLKCIFTVKKTLKKKYILILYGGKISSMKRINKYLSQIIGYHNLLEWNLDFDKHIYIFHGCKNIISCNISMSHCAYKILYFIPCENDKQFVSCC